jgi:adenosylhomocysteine nucleosidase
MGMPERLAIIAAMEREVHPLVRNWKQAQAGGLPAWRSGNMLVVCGGIGAGPARRAAECVMSAFNPSVLISVGFAGSLDSMLNAPDIFVPAKVVDVCSGKEFATGEANGTSTTLLTLDDIADVASKQALARDYDAQAVDMEAAAVARVAAGHGLEFRAVKAISEDIGFPLPSFAPFITAEGGLRSVSLAAHLAARPWLWASVLALRQNAARASRALALALRPLQSGGAPFDDVAQPSAGVG